MEENREAFKKFDYVERMAAMVLLGEQERLAKLLEDKGEEEFDMCQAIDELIEDGKEAGRSEGRRKGIQDGQLRINSLNQRLKADGRMDELLRSVDDLEFQKTLLKEYGL